MKYQSQFDYFETQEFEIGFKTQEQITSESLQEQPVSNADSPKNSIEINHQKHQEKVVEKKEEEAKAA